MPRTFSGQPPTHSFAAICREVAGCFSGPARVSNPRQFRRGHFCRLPRRSKNALQCLCCGRTEKVRGVGQSWLQPPFMRPLLLTKLSLYSVDPTLDSPSGSSAIWRSSPRSCRALSKNRGAAPGFSSLSLCGTQANGRRPATSTPIRVSLRSYFFFGGYFSNDLRTMSSSAPWIFIGSFLSSTAIACQTNSCFRASLRFRMRVPSV